MSDFNILPADIKIDWKILHFYTAWNFKVLNIKSICDLQLGDLPFFWANEINDIYIYFFFFFRNRIWHFMQNVSIGDNLYEMSKPVFCKK